MCSEGSLDSIVFLKINGWTTRVLKQLLTCLFVPRSQNGEAEAYVRINKGEKRSRSEQTGCDDLEKCGDIMKNCFANSRHDCGRAA